MVMVCNLDFVIKKNIYYIKGGGGDHRETLPFFNTILKNMNTK